MSYYKIRTHFAFIRQQPDARALNILMVPFTDDDGHTRYKLPSAYVDPLDPPFECFQVRVPYAPYEGFALRVYWPNERLDPADFSPIAKVSGQCRWLPMHDFINQAFKGPNIDFDPESCAYMRENLHPYLEAHHYQLLAHADVHAYRWRDAENPATWVAWDGQGASA